MARETDMDELLKKFRINKHLRRIFACIALVVAAATIYVMVLPAQTAENQAFCGSEDHTHDESCYETTLICGLTEHQHTDACYEITQALACGLEEGQGHSHTAACYQSRQVLTCTIQDMDHVHTDDCYQTEETLICGLEESAPHTHTDSCYTLEKTLVCPEAEHIHTDSCYETVLACEKAEHTHTLSCYSDPGADVETAADWEAALVGVKLTGNWDEDLLAVAETQLGYTESTKNYQVMEDGVTTKGYTRYGQWYGDPYGDWCAMFVSFCLRYAEIPETEFPREASCPRWTEALSQRGLYTSAQNALPRAGDLVFFDVDGDGISDHVGLAAEVKTDNDGNCTEIKTLEGNSDNRVQYVTYGSADSRLMGYGLLPENPEKTEESGENEAVSAAPPRYYAYSGDEVEVTVALPGSSGVPEDAELAVTPITREQENYETLMEQAREAAAGEIREIVLYDISFFTAGGEYIPVEESAVVTIRFTQELVTEAQDTVEVIHLPENAPAETLPEVTATEALDGEGIAAVEFETPGFSTFALALTSASANGISLASETDAFTYSDDTGFSVTLELINNQNYTPNDYELVVNDYSDASGYENVLSKYTTNGQVIKEKKIYYICLRNKSTNQEQRLQGCQYSMTMTWTAGLFTNVTDDGILDFVDYAYCNNSKSDPQPLTCTPTMDENKNVTELTVTSQWFPNSGEFVFVHATAANGLTSNNGNYKLTYNTTKDAFITESAYAEYYNANSPIGTAGSFHLVGFEKVTLNSHVNGNILANTLIATGHNFGTNNYPDELSYIQYYEGPVATSASSVNHTLVVGSVNTVEPEVYDGRIDKFKINNVSIGTPYNLIKDKDTETAPFIDLNRVKQEIQSISKNLSAYLDKNLTLSTDKKTLTLSEPSGVGVIELTAADLSGLNDDFSIWGFQTGCSGTVVINVDCTGATEVKMPGSAKVYVGETEQGTGETTDFSAGKVIWNFINTTATTKIITASHMTGIILAPDAYVHISGNVNGTVVANEIYAGGESHRTDFTGTIIPSTDDDSCNAYITVKKTEHGYYGTALPGAGFQLYKWNGSNWDNVTSTAFSTNTTTTDQNVLTSGTDGTFMLHHLTKDVAYKLVETKAPGGYQTDTFYFWVTTDDGKTLVDWPSEVTDEKYPVAVGGALIAADQLEDTGGDEPEPSPSPSPEPETTTITVNKVWMDADGVTELKDNLPDLITVGVYQAIKNADGTSGTPTKVLDENGQPYTLTLNASDGWRATSKDLLLTGDGENGAKVDYVYSIREAEVAGYTPEITKNGDGTYTITNTKTSTTGGEGGDTPPDYQLPSTGGPGVVPYLIGGVLLLLLWAGFLLPRVKRRARRF